MKLAITTDEALDLLLDRHYAQVEFDYDSILAEDTLPVNPGREQGIYSAWAVMHSKGACTHEFPEPNLTIPLSDGQEVSVWYTDLPIFPDTAGYDSAVNKWKQIITALVYELKGVEVKRIPSPVAVTMEMSTHTQNMKDMTLKLNASKKFRHTLHADFINKGANVMSDKKTEARSANFAKAREVRARQQHEAAVERDILLMKRVDLGASKEELAVFLQVAPQSVPVYVSRARQRLGLTEVPVEAPKPVEAHVEAPEAIVESQDLKTFLEDLGVAATEEPKAEEKFPHKRPTSVSEDDLLLGLDIDF